MKFAILFFLLTNFAQASIINPVPSPSPLPSSLAAKSSIVHIKSAATALFTRDSTAVNNLYNLIWNNVNGLTPQQVYTAVDQFGNPGDQCVLRTLFLNLSSILNSVVAGTVPAEPGNPINSGTGSSCVVIIE